MRTIENWAAAGHIQQNEKGKYGQISAFKYLLAKKQARIEQLHDDLGKCETELDNPHKSAKERKIKAEADKEEAIARIKQLELEKLEGKLVDAEEVLNAWKNAIANAKAKFINIPAKLAWELSGLDRPEAIQQRLTESIDEALIELGSFGSDDNPTGF